MSKRSITTVIFMTIPMVFGFLILVVWDKYVQTHYGGVVPKTTNALMVGLTFLTWSLSFVVAIVRKEFPSFIFLRGAPAIIIGSIGLLMSLFLGISLLLKYFGVF